jgi:hypothetical protein
VDLFTPSPKFFNGPQFGPLASCSDCCGGAPFESVFDEDEPNNCRETQIPNRNINDVYIGNILIIQEKGTNEPFSCPDDSAAGGTITFDFCEPVIFKSSQLLDIDGVESAQLEFHYSDGRPAKTILVPGTGDNGVFTKEYMESNVISLSVTFSGSGGISAISYCKGSAPIRRGLRQSLHLHH